MILMIDNYDSFTWNLVQYFGELGADMKVVLNDELSVAEVAALKPEKIVISPGPCSPNEAGISLDVINTFAGKLPILGVCLGHQALGQAFGGKVVHAQTLMHGKTSPVEHTGQGVFKGLPSPFTATPERMHGSCRISPTGDRCANFTYQLRVGTAACTTHCIDAYVVRRSRLSDTKHGCVHARLREPEADALVLGSQCIDSIEK